MTPGAATVPSAGRYRGWLLAAGVLLSVVSALYLIRYALAHQAELRATRLDAGDLIWAAGACALYGGALLFTALGWLGAVRACRNDTPATKVIGIALVSQIGKYAPGNVAQHIGRAVFAGGHGMGLPVVTKSTLFELASAVAAGVIVALLGGAGTSVFSDAALIPEVPHWLIAAGAALALIIAGVMLLPGLRRYREKLSLAPGPAAATFACHLVSAALAGLSFYAVVAAFAPGVSAPFCVALFSVAWLLGFVTPGAPAGLGVREAVLVIGLSSTLGPMSFTASIMHRLITALADGVMALAGVLALRASGTSGDRS